MHEQYFFQQKSPARPQIKLQKLFVFYLCAIIKVETYYILERWAELRVTTLISFERCIILGSVKIKTKLDLNVTNVQ